MKQFPFDHINQIDIVNFLAKIGIQPIKTQSRYYFYCSPLVGHPANRATFIVDLRLNQWWETTTKQGGNLVDLAIRLYNCTIGELTTIFQAALSPVSQTLLLESSAASTRIKIQQIHSIRSIYLERFLWERRIPLHVARLYCLEACYNREKAVCHALAFRNDAGGLELFNRNRLYRIPTFSPTHIRNQSQAIAVFRHVLDLLTYITIFANPITKLADFLVLNAPVDFQVVRGIITQYHHKHLFLPNDASGIAFSTQVTRTCQNFQDHRFLYARFPTLNDWVCYPGTASGT